MFTRRKSLEQIVVNPLGLASLSTHTFSLIDGFYAGFSAGEAYPHDSFPEVIVPANALTTGLLKLNFRRSKESRKGAFIKGALVGGVNSGGLYVAGYALGYAARCFDDFPDLTPYLLP